MMIRSCQNYRSDWNKYLAADTSHEMSSVFSTKTNQDGAEFVACCSHESRFNVEHSLSCYWQIWQLTEVHILKNVMKLDNEVYNNINHW